MVQGKTKGLQQKSGNNSRHAAKAAANMKKGKRTIAPKKEALLKQAALHKSLSSKINASVEKQMVNAASAGKLTIMRGVVDEAETSAGPSKKKTKS